MTNPANNIEWLKNNMVDAFNIVELQELAFNLRIKFEELPGTTLTSKTISLIEFCIRRNKLESLRKSLVEDPDRKHINWNEIDWSIKSFLSSVTPQQKLDYLSIIDNAHSTIETILEELDPRFSIEGMSSSKGQYFELKPNEDVLLSFTIPSKHSQQLRDLFDHGKKLEVDSNDIDAEGSPLIEQIFDLTKTLKNGKFFIFQPERPAIQKMWLTNPETQDAFFFDDLAGGIVVGEKTFSYSGTACNDIFKIDYSVEIGESNEEKSSSFQFKTDLSSWDGISIRSLPYLDKLFKFFQKLANGWLLTTALEIDGNEIVRFKPMSMKSSQEIQNINFIFSYITCAKEIASKVASDIIFEDDFSYDSENLLEMERYLHIFQEKGTLPKDRLQSPFEVKLKGFNGIPEESASNPSIIALPIQERSILRIFNTNIELPQLFLFLSPVLVKIQNIEDTSAIINIIPQEGCEGFFRFAP